MEFAYLQETQPEAGAGEDAEMNSDGEEERGVFTRQELVEKVRDVSRQEHVEVSCFCVAADCALT